MKKDMKKEKIIKVGSQKDNLSNLEVNYLLLRWGFLDGKRRSVADVAQKLNIKIKDALKTEGKILNLIAEKGVN
jgi:DNA-directed RNA polymerase sigma subunit (sigma70/sigma32)